MTQPRTIWRLLYVAPIVMFALASLGPATADAATKKTKPVKKADVKAEGELMTSIRVIQQRPFLKRKRIEVQLLGGLAVTDTMFRHLSLRTNLRYHLNETWAVGASYSQFFASESDQLRSITEGFEVFPERSFIKYYAGVDAAWSPLYGKFTFFGDSVVHFDTYLTFGAGILQTNRSSAPTPSINVGLGGHLLLNRWFTVVMEIRDHLFVESFNAGAQVVNHITLTLGFSIFFPLDFTYKFQK